jgi:hypothetical protein
VFHHFHGQARKRRLQKKLGSEAGLYPKHAFAIARGGEKFAESMLLILQFRRALPKRRLAVSLRVACAVLTRIVRADSARFACAFFTPTPSPAFPARTTGLVRTDRIAPQIPTSLLSHTVHLLHEAGALRGRRGSCARGSKNADNRTIPFVSETKPRKRECDGT